MVVLCCHGDPQDSDWTRAADLAGPAAFHELDRGPKQLEIFLVLGRLGAIDLYPFSRTCHAAGLKRNDVVPRELQFGRSGHGQAHSDAVAADAGEHPVADEIGVKAIDFPRADTRELEKQSVDLRLAAGLWGFGSQGEPVEVIVNNAIES